MDLWGWDLHARFGSETSILVSHRTDAVLDENEYQKLIKRLSQCRGSDLGCMGARIRGSHILSVLLVRTPALMGH